MASPLWSCAAACLLATATCGCSESDGARAVVAASTLGARAPDAGPAASGLATTAIVDPLAPPPFNAQAAVKLSIPTGWATAGGIDRDVANACAYERIGLRWMASSPDGRSAIELLPGHAWEPARAPWQDMPGGIPPMSLCNGLAFASVREFLTAIVSKTRTDARVLEYLDWPDEVERLKAMGHADGMGAGQRIDAGKLLVGYSREGVDMRELLVAHAIVRQSLNGEGTYGVVNGVAAYRAPESAFDAGLLPRVLGSLEVDPQWASAVVQPLMSASGATRPECAQDVNPRMYDTACARERALRHALRTFEARYMREAWRGVQG